jgi:hypothetical protein
MKDYTLKEMLVKRRYLVEETVELDSMQATQNAAYYNAFLLSNFGIVVDQPLKLTAGMLGIIKDVYRLEVPASYFKHPQDMQYYTQDELFIEQFLSYVFAYGAENSHVEVFAKELPQYEIGTKIKLREFKILTEAQAAEKLSEICQDYAFYKRPWSTDEAEEFAYLYDKGFYNQYEIKCADNAILLLPQDVFFAKFLFKKDLVKLSRSVMGDQKTFELPAETKRLIKSALPFVKDCPMTKKQAKYFNTLVKKCDVQVDKASNQKSPYKAATAMLQSGDVLGAAEVYANSGSLLERNLKMLLSRANPVEAVKILDMLSDQNPIVLYQLMSTINADDSEGRTFSFFANRKVRTHVETEYEAKWRKSRLNDSTKKLVHDVCFDKIASHYKALEPLGKVYVHPDFYKVAMPVNTSASGKGIDVPPVGTRLPLKGSKIRTFVHWENAFDIDSSVTLVNKNGENEMVYWGNYGNKAYGTDVSFSGDVTSANGTEYYDVDLEGLKAKGYKMLFFSFHGFRSTLDDGDIHCGYQVVENFKTKAWDPKNIELKIHVKGEKRAYTGFAIDLEKNEVIVINILRDDDSRIVSDRDSDSLLRYVDPAIIELNMGLIASWRGELVETPEEADVVFMDDYKPTEAQTHVRSFDIEKLNSLVTA